jgi:hypothetical protein
MAEALPGNLLAYIGAMLRLVGRALVLDTAAFQEMVALSDSLPWLPFWVVFVAGLSRTLGQSLVLFANQVRPARFAIALVLGALQFVLNVLTVMAVIWAMANLLSPTSVPFSLIGRSLALASAPYWLSVFVLIPYLGPGLKQALMVYTLVVLVTAIQTAFGLGFFRALLAGLVAVAIAEAINVLLSRLLSPFAHWLHVQIVGKDAIQSTQEIYEMFASRNQVVQ